ncbi:hypothetical protein [Bartonella sp. HY406]|uniref:hypothetical protein n=1 Tax=Bartonella sp. HY406 TaxID=2979331 RepID=UPI0021C93176|nr:hypothetical protein [Bartonella sp. HY406]UXN03613.1 hypothetical protein N6B01_00740 [Bartonella sp. HY406]
MANHHDSNEVVYVIMNFLKQHHDIYCVYLLDTIPDQGCEHYRLWVNQNIDVSIEYNLDEKTIDDYSAKTLNKYDIDHIKGSRQKDLIKLVQELANIECAKNNNAHLTNEKTNL